MHFILIAMKRGITIPNNIYIFKYNHLHLIKLEYKKTVYSHYQVARANYLVCHGTTGSIPFLSQ